MYRESRRNARPRLRRSSRTLKRRWLAIPLEARRRKLDEDGEWKEKEYWVLAQLHGERREEVSVSVRFACYWCF